MSRCQLEAARQYFENAFFNPKRYDLTRVGRYKLNRKLGPEIERIADIFKIDLERPTPTQGVLSPSEILASATYVLHLAKHMADGGRPTGSDDQDHFASRRIRSVGELIQNQVPGGAVPHGAGGSPRADDHPGRGGHHPQTLINIRPVVAAVKEFFGTSQLSQFMDQNNPLSGLAHKRRLSALGPGGLSRERAGFEVAATHHLPTTAGCRTPSRRPKARTSRPDRLAGHLRPGQRVRLHRNPVPQGDQRPGDQGDHLPGRRRRGGARHRPGLPAAARRPTGRFTEEKVLVVARPQGTGVRVGAASTSYGTTSGDRLRASGRGRNLDGRLAQADRVGVGTAHDPLRPSDDDAKRALMGANMQKQAVPLVVPEAPYIGTGVEARAARDAGDVVLAEAEGTVVEVSGEAITVEYKAGAKDRNGFDARWPERGLPPGQVPPIQPEHGHSNQKVIVDEGQKVTKGEVLADGPSTHNGELALGKNLLVAFMPWKGHNYEDAIVISERLVKDDVLTSIHIEEHEIDARDTKLGAEEITRDIPNLSEDILGYLDERGIIRIGAEVGPGDVLVGNVTPKGETEQTPEERLLRAIFGEKAREVRDTSSLQGAPTAKQGTVANRRAGCFSREDAHELPPRRGAAGPGLRGPEATQDLRGSDKLAGRHGNKGVISTILPRSMDMPFQAGSAPRSTSSSTCARRAEPDRTSARCSSPTCGYAARWGWDGAGDVATTPMRGTETKTRPRTEPAVWVSTPVFDGAHWDEEDQAGRHPTIQLIFRAMNPDGEDGSIQVNDRRARSQLLQRAAPGAFVSGLRQPGLGRLRPHPEAPPPGRRQDPRPLHRPRTR